MGVLEQLRQEIASEERLKLYEDIRTELGEMVNYNQMPGIDLKKLTVRQQNAIFNGIDWTIQKKIRKEKEQIAKYVK